MLLRHQQNAHGQPKRTLAQRRLPRVDQGGGSGWQVVLAATGRGKKKEPGETWFQSFSRGNSALGLLGAWFWVCRCFGLSLVFVRWRF
ncbi:MAG TPA: hypothetical protein PKA06_04685, partial [Gemmatales bacterium]|nr:hypothetical protein [Gemmatales bacterium]